MSDIAIRVEKLGKRYHIGKRERYRTFRDTLTETMTAPFRWVRNGRSANGNRAPEHVWALKDISFEIPRGEVVGVIGKNGAGKSTLLKVLSRITEPTEGRAEIHGRVGSLLEVGTGFHPELTGRENIYLNGAILGMRKTEIARKFDEIVAFAEIEKFLDTPVKHYSSGMYMRLAFAVAAHLETDIMIVDEVLAVGDADFQKKCLGKMGEVAKHGRTVLFVSHNMAAVKSLTTSGILLDCGRVSFHGRTPVVIQRYVDVPDRSEAERARKPRGRGDHTKIRAVWLRNISGERMTRYVPGELLLVNLEIETDGAAGLSLEIFLKDETSSAVGMASTYQFHGQVLPSVPGVYRCQLELDGLWLASGSYTIDVSTSVVNHSWDHYVQAAIDFDVPFSNPLGLPYDFKQSFGFGPLALLSSRTARFDPITTERDRDYRPSAQETPAPRL